MVKIRTLTAIRALSRKGFRAFANALSEGVPLMFFEYLKKNRFGFEAILFCTRNGATDIIKILLKTGILVMQVTKQLISRRKQLHY